MEPFGTVTNFYPFLSKETRTIVESTLKVAEGYDDFVSRLVDVVVAQEETNDLSYFTTFHADISHNRQIFDRLRGRVVDDDVLRPWAYRHFDWGALEDRHFDWGALEDLSWEKMPSYLEHALNASPSNWVRVHILVMAAKNLREMREISSCQKYIDEAIELTEKHSELTCFLAEIYSLCGNWYRLEGNITEAMNQFEQARRVAEEHNDLIGVGDAIEALALCLKETDVYQAINLMEESYQIFKTIRAMNNAGSAASNLGLLVSIIGEYDLAIEFYKESNRISEDTYWNKAARVIVLTRLYCDLDLPEEALEWIKWRRDGEDITPKVLKELPKTAVIFRQSCLAVARVLIQLGQLEGVSQLLSEVHKQTLQDGSEVVLIEYHFMSGLLEFALGNHKEGMQMMAVALGDAERLKYQVLANSHLIALVKAEVQLSKKGESSGDAESSGLWMTKLGLHAREKNYPGIMMQHALLKAEYQEMVGETEAARLTLQDALTFTDSPGVKTLRKRILEKLDELRASVDA